MWSNKQLHDKAVEVCGEHKLIFLTMFGSRLFGTFTENSDQDVKGVFMPSKESLYLQNAPRTLSFTTGDGVSKNSKDDVDIELFSLHYFLELLAKGNSNMVSVLFAGMTSSNILYMDTLFEEVMEMGDLLYDKNNVDAFLGFSYEHASKYALKVDRYETVKMLVEYFHDVVTTQKMESIDFVHLFEQMSVNNVNQNYVFLEEDENGKTYLNVFNTKHMLGIFVHEFVARMNKELAKYGNRVKAVSDGSQETDWKALSHSFRTVYEAKQLLKKGYYEYPLPCAEFLLDVKNAQYSLEELRDVFRRNCNEVEELKHSMMKTGVDKKYTNELLLKLYERK